MAGLPDSVWLSVSIENRGICRKRELVQLNLDEIPTTTTSRIVKDSKFMLEVHLTELDVKTVKPSRSTMLLYKSFLVIYRFLVINLNIHESSIQFYFFPSSDPEKKRISARKTQNKIGVALCLKDKFRYM